MPGQGTKNGVLAFDFNGTCLPHEWLNGARELDSSIADYTLLVLFFALSRQEIKLDIRVLDFEEDGREISRGLGESVEK